MVSPLLPAGGLFRSRLPAVSRVPLLSEIRSLLDGPSETADLHPELPGDDALLAQIAARDPSVLAAVLREVDRRLSDDVPEDAARLERLRELLRRLEAEPAVPPFTEADREPSGEAEPRPTGAVAPPPDVPPTRPAVAKDLVRALTGAAAPAGRPPAAQEPLVERVLRASRLVRSRGISRLRLVLDPPELGEVRLDLSLQGRIVTGTFQAESPGAAEALGARLSELRDALERRGLRVGGLSVVAPGADPAAPPANPFLAPPSLPGNLDLKA